MSGKAPSEAFNSISSDLSGTLKGTAVALNLGFSHSLHGKLDGGQFSLNIPQPNGKTEAVTCRPASMADWNKKIAALHDKLNEENNRQVNLQST